MNSISRKIIIFDGSCGLCNRIVQFIKHRDKKHTFILVSNRALEDDLREKFFDLSKDTIIYLLENSQYTKSTACLHIFKDMNGIWRLLYIFILVPKTIRDFVYDQIAKNRRFFGNNNCKVG